MDARWDLPGRPYADHRIEMLTESTGDGWARMRRLRMREIEESLRWLGRAIGRQRWT